MSRPTGLGITEDLLTVKEFAAALRIRSPSREAYRKEKIVAELHGTVRSDDAACVVSWHIDKAECGRRATKKALGG